MNVKLLSIPRDPAKIIWTAARTCTSANGPVFLWDVKDRDYVTLAKKIWRLEHYSVFEHVSLTYAVEEISRACLAQLTRHRHLSFSVQSQRYVNMVDYYDGAKLPGIIPKSIDSDPDRLEIFQRGWAAVEAACGELQDCGVLKEDVRALFPMAVPTNLVLSCNLRSLGELYQKRVIAKGAQKEIKDLVSSMVECIENECGWFVELLRQNG